MKLEFDSEVRDAMVRALTIRPIPMAHVEDVVGTLRQLKPVTDKPQSAPTEVARQDEAG